MAGLVAIIRRRSEAGTGIARMELIGKTVVITGASSGIGRATAEQFAKAGCAVVLAARRKSVLDEVAAGCRRLGALAALAIEADVTDFAAMQEVAKRARDECGGLHVWVNNAGVGIFGPFPEGGVEAHVRVVETNLIGTIHGAAAALPIMRAQGAGTLIAVSSVGGLVPVPYAATYAASKAGIRAFQASLREELRNEPGLAVCTVLPSFVDTPAIEHHGANVSGRELKPTSGEILAPELVAEKIVGLARAPRAEVDIGWATRGARIGGALSPSISAWAGGIAVRRYLSQAKPQQNTMGNLFEKKPEGTSVSGTLRSQRRAR